jgi:hypothetical protein
MRKEHAPPFFAPISGPARNGKQGRCAHTCYFCVAGSPAKMLVGELPKPAGLLDTLSRSPCCLRPGAIAPGPYPARPYVRADGRCSP